MAVRRGACMIASAQMIVDFNHCEDRTQFEADVCIVGGGMAGLTIARSLLGSGLRVLLIESGGLVRDPHVEALNRVESDGPETLDFVSTRPRVPRWQHQRVGRLPDATRRE